MSDWILKLTGSTVEAGSEVVGYGVETAGGVAWGYIALLAVLLVALVGMQVEEMRAAGRRVHPDYEWTRQILWHALLFIAAGLFLRASSGTMLEPWLEGVRGLVVLTSVFFTSSFAILVGRRLRAAGRRRFRH